MAAESIWNGIIIGAVGGSIAGLMVPLSAWIVSYLRTMSDKNRVYHWLEKNTANTDGKRFRSTRTIASYNNLTQDRVRYVCSIHKEIFLSTGEVDDMWGIFPNNPSRKRAFKA